MSLRFKPVEAADLKMLEPFYARRPNKTCDSVVLDSLIWQKYYHVRFAVSENRAVQWLMEETGVPHSAMPVCAQADLPKYFDEITAYFNEVLHAPLKINLADEEAVTALRLKDRPDFRVTEQADLKDYLYDGEALRTLAGRKYHKKKNLVNAFQRAHGEHALYRRIACEDREAVLRFLDAWREKKGEDAEAHLDFEVEAIHGLVMNCGQISSRMGGVFVDGRLEAFTVGSYNPLEDMAVIHIEKANSDLPGLYQFINQQFLVNEFPTVKLVNREDDLGLPGLRRAKESYHPVGYARKFLVEQLSF